MEPPFDKLEGVISTTSGYAGGHVQNPTYQQVSAGSTGHAEVVQVVYDPKRISYQELLDVFWLNVDPLDSGGQFCDRGNQYRTEIVALNGTFYPAEEYHQDYYIKNPLRYKYYRTACGRDRRLQQLWGD